MRLTLPSRAAPPPRSLIRSTRGVALIEFAISLPVLLTLGLVGLEIANFAISHLRVSNIAVTTADNAARIRDSIDESDVDELFIGATLAGDSIGFAERGRVILSDLEASQDGTKQWIRWQRCHGTKDIDPTFRPLKEGGAAITDGTEIYRTDRRTLSSDANKSSEDASTLTGIGPAANRIAAQGGTAIMVAQVHYDYQPLIGNSVTEGKVISYTSAFNVRQRNDHSIRNAGRMAPKSCGD